MMDSAGLEVDAAPCLLPVAVARRLQSLRPTDLSRPSVNIGAFIRLAGGSFGHHFGPPPGVGASVLPVGTVLLGRDGVLLRLFKGRAQRLRVNCRSLRGLAEARHQTLAQFDHDGDYEGIHADFQDVAPRPVWPSLLEAPAT